MIRGTEADPSGVRRCWLGGLGYPVAFTVARAARDPDDRHGPERDQDGTA
jgi:hypothetical protein